MQISITMLCQTGGHGDGWQVCGGTCRHRRHGRIPARRADIVDGPDEMRRKVRELIRAGADVIKVCTSAAACCRRATIRATATSATTSSPCSSPRPTAAGRWVMAHAQATDGIKAAVRAGIRSIEHGIYLDDEAIAMMLERGTYLVPTLDRADGRAGGGRPRRRRAADAIEKTRDGHGHPPRVASPRRSPPA